MTKLAQSTSASGNLYWFYRGRCVSSSNCFGSYIIVGPTDADGRCFNTRTARAADSQE